MPEHGQKPVAAKTRAVLQAKAMKRKAMVKATSAEAAAARALLRQR
jgi:hypothetical protein